MKRFVITLLSIGACSGLSAQISEEPYIWKNVIIGGGGYVTGIVLHPKVPDLAFIRTDVGGSYRWDQASESWIPMQDNIPPAEWNLYGADSIAVDPADASGQTVFLATGKYDAPWAKTPGVIFRSSDRGSMWERLPVESSGSSNTDQTVGERLMVDPRNPRHVLYASRSRGLLRTIDGGSSWTTVDTAPKGHLKVEGKPETDGLSGLSFVVFDPARASGENSAVIYLGASGEGVFRSQDGGQTWDLLPESPERPRRAVLGSDGALQVTHSTGLARFANEHWTDITPPQMKGQAAQAIAVDPRDARHLLVAPGLPKHQLPVFRSTDAGASWEQIPGVRRPTVPWWPDWHWFSATSGLAFDPHYPLQVWATDWYGVYHTPDITAPEVEWTNRALGHEELVTVGAMTTLPEGDIPLFSGVADVGGFDHLSLTKYPAENIWKKGFPDGFTCTGIAFQPSNPLFMARVGTRDWNKAGHGGFSRDGGKTWQLFPSLPYEGIKGGRVAIAATGSRILWAPQIGEPYFTDDFGVTWIKSESEGALKALVRGGDVFQYHQPLAADGQDLNRFYAFKSGNLWLSEDGGARWQKAAHLEDEGTHALLSVPHQPGHLWIAMNNHGLRRSVDGGLVWSRLSNVTRAALLALGKNPPGREYPALYLLGAVKQEEGMFRSDDEGESWVRIDTPEQRLGDQPNTLAGDWQHFGRVFVGTNGRGILYGEPVESVSQ